MNLSELEKATENKLLWIVDIGNNFLVSPFNPLLQCSIFDGSVKGGIRKLAWENGRLLF
jgi:hypothetical protein